MYCFAICSSDSGKVYPDYDPNPESSDSASVEDPYSGSDPVAGGDSEMDDVPSGASDGDTDHDTSGAVSPAGRHDGKVHPAGRGAEGCCHGARRVGNLVDCRPASPSDASPRGLIDGSVDDAEVGDIAANNRASYRAALAAAAVAATIVAMLRYSN